MGAPGIIDDATRVRAYEDLRAPIADLASRGIAPRPDAVRRIDDKLRYLRAVKDASGAPPPRRALIAIGEISSGRWWKYSPRTILVDKRLDAALPHRG